ncbi:hypothetical protein ACGF5T_16885 [Streptomyces sp. NPDC047853]|uniref:hypothetical protein n=1 Tax=unclassified Streptomyces TaxID=2593676 RepID=UPI003452A62E
MAPSRQWLGLPTSTMQRDPLTGEGAVGGGYSPAALATISTFRFSFHEINDYEGDPGSYGSGLDICGNREDPRLFAWIGDPDDCTNMSIFSRESLAQEALPVSRFPAMARAGAVL